jgi:hypothetical protein
MTDDVFMEAKFYQKFYFNRLCPKSCTGVSNSLKTLHLQSHRDPILISIASLRMGALIPHAGNKT